MAGEEARKLRGDQAGADGKKRGAWFVSISGERKGIRERARRRTVIVGLADERQVCLGGRVSGEVRADEDDVQRGTRRVGVLCTPVPD